MDERPTTEDLLERDGFIRRLGNALVKDDNSRATGVVVGITGEWGSGKSSILKMAAKHLEDEHKAIVISFDPWIISGRDDLITRLLVQIAQKLGADDRGGDVAKKVLRYVEALKPVVGAAGAAFGVSGAGALVTMGTSTAKKFLPPPDLHERRDGLMAALSDCKAPIIVMIDEIDRLDDGEIRAVAQFVRAVADFDRISYLLAYDQKRVAEALGNDAGWRKKDRVERGTAYLEKIVQYQIPLPVLVKEQLLVLFDRFVSPHLPEGWTSDERWGQLRDLLLPGVLGTPRDIKRLGGAVQIQSVLGEVDPVDLVGWCALQVKCPHAVDVIRGDPALVGGPDLSHSVHDWEGFVGRSAEALRQQFMDQCAPSDEIMRLLDFLFPVRVPGGSTEGRHPDCLCFDRPLMTVLRHGIPQGQFSRADINAFLKADSETRQRTLAKVMEDGLFDPFHIRLAEIYPSTPELDQAQLWCDIAAFFTNSATPWPVQPTPYHRLHRKFFDTMVGTGIRHHHEVICAGLHNAYVALNAGGDWQILPTMLNTQLWHYGLLGRRRSENRLPFLSKIQTEVALSTFKERLRAQFLADSDVVGRLRSIDALFIMVDAVGWSKECQEKMTGLLSQPRILDSLILLFFYGDFRLDKAFFEKFFDFATYQTEVERRIIGGLDDCHPTLAALYLEIRATGLPRP